MRFLRARRRNRIASMSSLATRLLVVVSVGCFAGSATFQPVAGDIVRDPSTGGCRDTVTGRFATCPSDGPSAETQFKTLKYRPDFPERFGSIEDARAFCARFFEWYNQEHHHSGLALLTPADVVALISRHPDTCHALFRRDVIQDWCVRDTLHGWASAQACTSLEESVRSWGGTYPWAKDPYLWGELLKSWEARSPDAAAASTA